MTKQASNSSTTTTSTIYEIGLQGHIGPKWSAWFDEMQIVCTEDGVTLLTGPIVDQAALYGLLKKVRDLGLPLVSVNRI